MHVRAHLPCARVVRGVITAVARRTLRRETWTRKSAQQQQSMSAQHRIAARVHAHTPPNADPCLAVTLFQRALTKWPHAHPLARQHRMTLRWCRLRWWLRDAWQRVSAGRLTTSSCDRNFAAAMVCVTPTARCTDVRTRKHAHCISHAHTHTHPLSLFTTRRASHAFSRCSAGGG